MVVLEDSPNYIYLTLKELIEAKSKRDKVKFTACQLAQALDMPRSIITKLTHPNASKRVTNPKIDTIIKIVNFFKTNGFEITIDDLLKSVTPKSVSIKNQEIPPQNKIDISLYSLSTEEKMGVVDINIANKHKNTIALFADRDIKPFFKKGSIFIVDTDLALENDMLVAIKLPNHKYIQIKKYYVLKGKIVLKSFDEQEEYIMLMPSMQCNILGVIVQINAHT